MESGKGIPKRWGMKRSSATCALLILSSLLAGSSWSGPIVRQSRIVNSVSGPLRPESAVAPLFPIVSAVQGRDTHACDTWLMLALAGGLVALQLRRTHRGVQLGSRADWSSSSPERDKR